MDPVLKRSNTPPPSQLLTPPPSGGFGGRVHFIDVYDNQSKRQKKFKEGESLTEFFEEIQQGSNVEIHDITDDESPIDSFSGATTPSTPTSAITAMFEDSISKDSVHFNVVGNAGATKSADTTPFPFLKLPLAVRKQVYEYLLVVPAFVCARQNYVSFQENPEVPLVAERRELLSGLSSALVQGRVNGSQVPFSRFGTANVNILYSSKEVYAEAKPILYSMNDFEIVRPTEELSPPPDFNVRLFLADCQRMVTKLNIRIRSFYDLGWVLHGGFNTIKYYYRGLETLTFIMEINSTDRGFGKQWSRRLGEHWVTYVNRLQDIIGEDLFGAAKLKKTIPHWIDLRVLFHGEVYHKALGAASGDLSSVSSSADAELLKRAHLAQSLVEAWELFKKGGHGVPHHR